MKFFSLLAGFFLALGMLTARAQQGPDDQFVGIYSLIQQADALADAGQPRLALTDYLTAQADLEKFAHIYPEWSPNIIAFRRTYLADKIAAATALLPPPSAGATTNATAAADVTPAPNADTSATAAANARAADLRAQMQALQAENATLSAKLKEALSAQPAAVDPRDLAAEQDKNLALMKENDLLRASETGTQPEAKAGKKISDRALQEKIKTLEARLAVDEMTAVPYSEAELALFQPAALTLTAPSTLNEVDHTLPAGSDELVASAKAHFAAHEYGPAAADYQKVLQLDVHNGYVLANLATIELQEGDLPDAEKHAQAAVDQNPNDAFALSVLGNLKFQQAKYDQALDLLSKAAKLDPQNARIQSLLGVSLGHKGLRLQAETALRKALLEDPDYAAAHYNLAVVYIAEQPPKAQLARWHYEKAIAGGQPHNPDLEKMLADNGAAIATP